MEADGSVVAHMIYDPWGAPLLETYTDTNYSGLDNLNNFTGYAWDETLGLYYAQNRFYDATTHRFTQEDAIKDGGNWYAYCGNGPLNYTDPNGLWTFAIGLDFAAAFILRLSAGRQVVIDGEYNVAVLDYVGVGGGTPTAELSATATLTSAKNVKALAGWGSALGGSLEVEAEFSAAEGLIGITLSTGIATPLPEAHTEVIYTGVRYVVDKKAREKIREWVEGKLSQYYDFAAEVGNVQRSIGIKASDLKKDTYAADEEMIKEKIHTVFDRFKDDLYFQFIYGADYESYFSKPGVTKAKDCLKDNTAYSILSAYKLFYVGCSRARRNLTILLDSSKIKGNLELQKKRFEEIGFQVINSSMH